MISHQGSLYQNITVSLGGRAKMKKKVSHVIEEKNGHVIGKRGHVMFWKASGT